MQLNIIELARQAGDDWDHTTKDDRAFLDRFAQLVAAAVKEECAKVCESMKTSPPRGDPEDVERGYNVALRRAADRIRGHNPKS